MAAENHDDHDHHPHGSAEGRSTAPQSEYTARETLVGATIALVGLLVTFGVPLAMLL
jgi:hypothetical protein